MSERLPEYLKQGELAFKHSVVLHELYFGNLTGGGSQGSTTAKLLNHHYFAFGSDGNDRDPVSRLQNHALKFRRTRWVSHHVESHAKKR